MKHLPVQADDAQRTKRPHFEPNDQQTLENADGGVEKSRQVKAPQVDHADQMREIDITENVAEHGYGEEEKSDHGQEPQGLRKASAGLLGRRLENSAPEQPEKKKEPG